MKALLKAAFVGPNGRISTSRAIAVMCCVTGCALALWHPEASGTVTSLIGGGAVAIATREKKATP